jgi:hypothetical protein
MMYQFQNSLPSLPLPTLEETCNLYLQIVAPLLNPAEWQQTQAAVIDFQQGVGMTLQRQLEQIAQSTETSYPYDIGVKNFLENRSPLPIHISFGLVLSPLEGIPANVSPDFSLPNLVAHWIVRTLQVYLKIREGELEPDRETSRAGTNPLCMVQYKHLFGCARIPGIKSDTLQLHKSLYSGLTEVTDEDRQSIIVIRQNVFYSLDCIEAGQIVPIEAIAQQLKWILDNTIPEGSSAGTLTALNRTTWAVLHRTLKATSAENAHSLNLLDQALFVVCLDDAEPETLAGAARLALHGDGRNRWFDKPLQFIFSDHGQVGLNVEHAGLDGYAVMRCLSEIHKISQQPFETAIVSPSFNPPQKLQWVLSDKLQDAMQQAEQVIDQLINKTELLSLRFHKFGRDEIKQWGFSPDAIVQLAMQVTYVRLYGAPACTYESVHTRRFRYGRTEAMRSVTPESVELCRQLQADSTDAEKLEALKIAVSAHTQRIKACQQGRGVDRHLAALQLLAQLQGITPEIFQDDAYTQVLGKSVLSTSSLAADMGIAAFCFGPVVEHGYGIGYLIEGDRLTFVVSSRYRQTQQFVEHLQQALLDLGKLMR